MKKVILLMACTAFLCVSCQQEDLLDEIAVPPQNVVEPVEDINDQELYERQQLGVNSLSLASSQAAQSVLKLF